MMSLQRVWRQRIVSRPVEMSKLSKSYRQIVILNADGYFFISLRKGRSAMRRQYTVER